MYFVKYTKVLEKKSFRSCVVDLWFLHKEGGQKTRNKRQKVGPSELKTAVL